MPQGRPKKQAAEKRERAVMAKLTNAEGVFFDDLRKALGGEIPAQESAALRLAIREAGERRHLAWPVGEKAEPGEVTAAAPPAQEPRVIEAPAPPPRRGERAAGRKRSSPVKPRSR